jgi:serine/threonine protein kinase
VEELKAIAKELLGILDYLHNRQPPIIYRDIKPSNILLSDRSGHSPGQVYLIDFGSVQTAVYAGTRTVVGTYGYMPPEQFGGQSVPTSDLYALGATLIYLATGQQPDQLPQRELHILFEDRVSLSLHLIGWLQWMTEPSIDLRLKSTKQALEALEKSNLRGNRLTTVSKPSYSKVQVTNTRQMFEILIPVKILNCYERIVASGILLLSTYVFRMWFIDLFSVSEISIGWFIAILFLGGVLWLDLGILFILIGKVRLRLTQSEISEAFEILGLRCWPIRTTARQNIVKIELINFYYSRSSEGVLIAVPAQINIHGGEKMFVLGGFKMSCNKYLTSLEFDWLAQELSNRLNLPIIRELYHNDI